MTAAMSVTGRRLFYALRPGPELAGRLADIVNTVDEPGARRVPVSMIHMTLVFLGRVREPVVKPLTAGRLDSCPPAFELEINGQGWWPGPAVYWVGPKTVPAALGGLVAGLEAVARAADIQIPDRAWQPHITLLRDIHRPLNPAYIPLCWTVKEYCLLESRMEAGVPVYQELARWSLG